MKGGSAMKPFNLEKALSGDPLVTRCGHKVTDIKHYLAADQDGFCITALIHCHTLDVETFKKKWTVYFWRKWFRSIHGRT